MSDTVTDHDAAAEDAGRSHRRTRVAPFMALAIAVVLAGLFVVLAGADPSRNDAADSPLLGAAAPAVAGELADGTPWELAQRKGSWVVLNFFQSSCIPCQQEHPDLVRFAERQAARGSGGARLYTVVYDDSREEVEAFFAEEGGDWPVVYDPDGSFATRFGVSAVPETWIIDPNGVVRQRFISRVTADFLDTRLAELMAAG